MATARADFQVFDFNEHLGDDQSDINTDFDFQGHAVRRWAPIRLSELDPVPGLLGLLDQLRKTHSLIFVLHIP